MSVKAVIQNKHFPTSYFVSHESRVCVCVRVWAYVRARYVWHAHISKVCLSALLRRHSEQSSQTALGLWLLGDGVYTTFALTEHVHVEDSHLDFSRWKSPDHLFVYKQQDPIKLKDNMHRSLFVCLS